MRMAEYLLKLTAKIFINSLAFLECQIPLYGGVEPPFLKGDLEGFLRGRGQGDRLLNNLIS